MLSLVTPTSLAVFAAPAAGAVVAAGAGAALVAAGAAGLALVAAAAGGALVAAGAPPAGAPLEQAASARLVSPRRAIRKLVDLTIVGSFLTDPIRATESLEYIAEEAGYSTTRHPDDDEQ
jgi:hypothetical protein